MASGGKQPEVPHRVESWDRYPGGSGVERDHLGPSECLAHPCPESAPPVPSSVSPGQAHLYCPGCPWAVELPEGLSGGCYLGPESPVLSPGARPGPQAVAGSPRPGADPASDSHTGQQAAGSPAGREPGPGGGAAGSSWACFPGHWGTAAAGPPAPPHRCWVVCRGDWYVLGPSSLHLWRGRVEGCGRWAPVAVRGEQSHARGMTPTLACRASATCLSCGLCPLPPTPLIQLSSPPPSQPTGRAEKLSLGTKIFSGLQALSATHFCPLP